MATTNYQGKSGSLGIIKSFMDSLDKTGEQGIKAVDEAVNVASGGRFATTAELIKSFKADLKAYGGTSIGDAASLRFLKTYCDIDLKDEDTGAISGMNAGGATAKTADTVVANGSKSTSVPTGTSDIAGLTVSWPTEGVTPGTLTSSEEEILKWLNGSWIENALTLIKDSYGLTFSEADTAVKDIGVRFYSKKDNVLASVTNEYNSGTGVTTKLTLNVNMYYYGDIDASNANGVSATSGNAYLDRTIAHELVHGIMAANITGFSKLPPYIKEGLAELVHGIDDERGASYDENGRMKTYSSNGILQLALKKKASSISFKSSGNASLQDYSSGYMLLRYLAKQSVAAEGLSVSPDGDTVTLSGDYVKYRDGAEDYVYDLANTTATTLNVAATTGLIITGTNRAVEINTGNGRDTLYSGKGNETINIGEDPDDESGAGSDGITFMYNKGNGKDVINGFRSGKDVIRFYGSGKLSGYSIDDDGNLILQGGNKTSTITLTNVAGEDAAESGPVAIDIIDAKGNHSRNIYGKSPKKATGDGEDVENVNNFTYAEDVTGYFGNTKMTDTLTVTKSATIDLTKTAQYKSIDVINAENAYDTVYTAKVGDDGETDLEESTLSAGVTVIGGSSKATVKGGAGANLVTGGKGALFVTGGNASDTLTAGSGGGSFDGGVGDDVLTATTKMATLIGGVGNNTISSGKGGAFIETGSGTDEIYLGAGKDTVYFASSDSEGSGAVIYDFNPSKDVIMIEGDDPTELKDTIKYMGDNATIVSGTSDVVFSIRESSYVTVNGAVKKKITFVGYIPADEDGSTKAQYVRDYVTVYGDLPRDVLPNQKETEVTLEAPFSGVFDSRIYGSKPKDTFKKIDASAVTNSNVEVIGNSLANTIYAGKSGGTIRGGAGKDVIYAGGGNDVFVIGKSDAADTIYDFSTSDDKIVFDDDAGNTVDVTAYALATKTTKKTGVTALSLTVKSNKASAVLKDVVSVVGSKDDLAVKIGSTATVDLTINGKKHIFASDNTGTSTFNYAEGTYYHGGTSKKDVLSINGKATIDLLADAAMYQGIEILDASKVTSAATIKLVGGKTAVTLKGGSSSGMNAQNILIAGSKGSQLEANARNNVLYGGNGKDVFVINGRNTTIYDYGNGTDVIRFAGLDNVNNFDMNDVETDSETGNVDLSYGKGTTVTLINAMGKTCILQDTNGRQRKISLAATSVGLDSAYASYANSQKTVNLADGYTGDFVAIDYATTITKIDASKATGVISIYGNAKNNTILGSKGGGTYDGGAGNDVITFAKNNKVKDTVIYDESYGKDTVKNFESGIDAIGFGDGIDMKNLTVASSGANLVLKADAKNTLTIAGMANVNNVVTIDGKTYTFGKQNAANVFTYDSKVQHYYGSAKKVDTMRIGSDTAATYNLTADKFHDIDIFDASKLYVGKKAYAANGAVRINTGDLATAATIKGSASDDTFTCGTGEGAITYWFGEGCGHDTITSGASRANDVIYLDGIKDISLVDMTLSGSDLVITAGADSAAEATMTISGWSSDGLSTLQLASGTKYHLKTDTHGTLRAVRQV